MKSESDNFLAGGTRSIDLKVVANAVLVKEVAAGQVGTHHPRTQFLIARQASASQHDYIYCSPPSNSRVTSELMVSNGTPLCFCTFSIQLFIYCSSSSPTA